MADRSLWVSQFDQAIKKERDRIGKGDCRHIRPEQLYPFARKWMEENPCDDDLDARVKKEVAAYYTRYVPSSFDHDGQLELLLDRDSEIPMFQQGVLVHVASEEMRRLDWELHLEFYDEEWARRAAAYRVTRAAIVERRNAYQDDDETWPMMAARVYGWKP